MTSSENMRRFRNLLDQLYPPRTQHSTVIPANSIFDMTPNALRRVQNGFNRLPPGSATPPSPDELVIQKRGQRKPIVWSPDLDSHKQNSLLNLSSRDRTPVKNSTESDTTIKDAVKRRLSLTDIQESEFSSLKHKRTSLPSYMSLCTANKSNGQSNDNLVNYLRSLNQEQLVQLIMELIHEQETGVLCKNEKFRDIILKKIVTLDIQPLTQKLIALKHHIYIGLTSDSIHLPINAFQKALRSQGIMLQESQCWASLMNYVLEAWRVVEEVEKWDHKALGFFTFNCSKILSSFCIKALEKGNFETSALEVYIKSLENMASNCDVFQVCLQMAKSVKNKA
ncbi:uncharacterized protein LOC109853928 [Pseudomyrmex gracilis]|uniref:uncharacterized protein LOC109853928 n=1 Tax=Pseudomyrmex gracilis TaxID=219809 RepID=UPI000995CF7F|nr:uncharacterized protein LOC109853928 [Pseudomyrmex gracilis]